MLAAVGDALNLTRERVRQVELKAMASLLAECEVRGITAEACADEVPEHDTVRRLGSTT